MGDPSFEISSDGLEEGLDHLLELKRNIEDESEKVFGRVATQLADFVEEQICDNDRWAEADPEVTYRRIDDETFEVIVHGKDVYTLEWGGREGGIKSPMLLTSMTKAEREASEAVNNGLSNLFKPRRGNGGVRGVKSQEWHNAPL